MLMFRDSNSQCVLTKVEIETVIKVVCSTELVVVFIFYFFILIVVFVVP